MHKYPKMLSIYNRDEQGRMIFGEFSSPEIEYLANQWWYLTEKVDGTNIRVLWDGTNVTFKGRTDKAQIPPQLLIALTDLFEPAMFRDAFPIDVGCVCLYGEGYGAKIQKGGGNYRPDQGFALFDVWVDGVWLRWMSIQDIARKMDIEHVPVFRVGTLHDAVKFAREGFNSHWGDFTAEGLVARPIVPLCDRLGNRILTKIKHKDFK